MTQQEKEHKLTSWLNGKIDQAKQNGEAMFMGVPDNWFDHGKHCCHNGHVFTMYLKSELLGNVCMECSAPSHLFPYGATEEELFKAVSL